MSAPRMPFSERLKGAPIPEEWTMNSGENQRPLEVGMEVRLPSGVISPVVKVSHAGASIPISGKEVRIGESVFESSGRLVSISLFSEVEYRRRTTQSTKEINMARKQKETEEGVQQPRTRKSLLEIMGHEIGPLSVWMGANGYTVAEAVHAFTKLGADLDSVKVGGGVRKLIADRIWYGRKGKMTPATVSEAEAARVAKHVESFREAQAKAEAEKAEKPQKAKREPKAKAAAKSPRAKKVAKKRAPRKAKA